MTFSVVTPSRGDRPQFIDQCFRQLGRMNTRPNSVYHINYRPESEGYDLKTRLHKGWLKAKENGDDWLFVIEEDDFYPSDYFEKFIPFFKEYDFIGQATTIYYHLGAKVWREQNHNNRSSLFTTAFRVSALDNFNWDKAKMVFIDLDLWQHAKRLRKRFINTGAIGIKHGLGLCGGVGHKLSVGNQDPEMKWLQSKVDENSFEFYKSLSKKLQYHE